MEGLRNPEGSIVRLLNVRIELMDPIELDEYCRPPKRLCLPPDTTAKTNMQIIFKKIMIYPE